MKKFLFLAVALLTFSCTYAESDSVCDSLEKNACNSSVGDDSMAWFGKSAAKKAVDDNVNDDVSVTISDTVNETVAACCVDECAPPACCSTATIAPCCAPPPCCDAPNFCCAPPRCGKIAVSADVLFWRAHEDGLAYAIDGLKTSGNTPPPGPGSAKHFDWDHNTGYRINVDFIPPCFCWDIYLSYTSFKTKGSGSTYATPGNTLWETWGPPAGGTFIRSAAARSKIKFQSFDVGVGSFFCCRDCFTFRPFAGIEAVWTKDEFDIHYENEPFFQIINNRQSFNGVGPTIGLENTWSLCRCLHLFADAKYALLCGRFNVSRRDFVETSEGNGQIWVDTGDRFRAVRSLLDFKVGIGADVCICGMNFFAKVAWENLIFFQHNQFMRFTEGDINIVADTNIGNFWNTNTNLGFCGVTATFGIGF